MNKEEITKILQEKYEKNNDKYKYNLMRMNLII